MARLLPSERNCDFGPASGSHRWLIERVLLVLWNRMNSVPRPRGELYENALGIAERLVEQEPGRADYLRDLSVSYSKMGDLQSALGQGETARQFYEKALGIRERLVEQEPGRADYNLDLANSLARLADSFSLQRGLDILVKMRESDRLMPEHLPLLEFFNEMLQKVKAAGGGI
jgi:tetratricopeptide (TPR) repeat protein